MNDVVDVYHNMNSCQRENLTKSQQERSLRALHSINREKQSPYEREISKKYLQVPGINPLCIQVGFPAGTWRPQYGSIPA
jgi:hypothetical protein